MAKRRNIGGLGERGKGSLVINVRRQAGKTFKHLRQVSVTPAMEERVLRTLDELQAESHELKAKAIREGVGNG